MNINEIVGNNIRIFRKDKEIQQQDLANMLGLTRTTLSNMEKGKTATTLLTLYKIAKILDRSIHDIIPEINLDFEFEYPDKKALLIKRLEEKLNKLKYGNQI